MSKSTPCLIVERKDSAGTNSETVPRSNVMMGISSVEMDVIKIARLKEMLGFVVMACSSLTIWRSVMMET